MAGKIRKEPKTALQYVRRLYDVCKEDEYNLFRSPGRYANKKGARLFAREIGYGFNDFPQSQIKRAMDESYKIICARFYDKGFLKYFGTGVITKNEWEKEIEKGLKRAHRYKKYGRKKNQ